MLYNHLFDSFPLMNGISKGSSLSIMIFQIAFNEISKIAYLIPKIEEKYNMKTINTLESVVENILIWVESSGANISMQK